MHPYDMIAKDTFESGLLEPREVRFVADFLRAGMVAFDIGANIGQYTVIAAYCVRPTGRVHPSELSARVSQELQFNVALNALQPLCVFNQLALSNSIGTARLSRYENGAKVNSSLGRHERTVARIVGRDDVQTTTLDRYASERGIPRVDFIKIDVEGAELPVLRGASNLLFRPDASCILLQLSDINTAGLDYPPIDTWDLLRELGYNLFLIEASSNTVPADRSRGFIAGVNVFAAKPSSPQLLNCCSERQSAVSA